MKQGNGPAATGGVDGGPWNDRLVIRDARPSDFECAAKVMRAAYLQYRAAMPTDAWRFYLSDMMDVRSRLSEAQLIVAELGGRVVGTVTLYLKRGPGSEQTWPEGWAGIRLLAVAPRYRGQGIGRALMEECVARSRKSGLRTIGLHTTGMMEVARRMYEKMGFKRVPEYDFHPRPDVVVMAYRLDL